MEIETVIMNEDELQHFAQTVADRCVCRDEGLSEAWRSELTDILLEHETEGKKDFQVTIESRGIFDLPRPKGVTEKHLPLHMLYYNGLISDEVFYRITKQAQEDNEKCAQKLTVYYKVLAALRIIKTRARLQKEAPKWAALLPQKAQLKQKPLPREARETIDIYGGV